jgi:2'-5' RNA ligase
VSELIRGFIAVNIPPPSAEKIRGAQERLRAADASVKWVDPDSLHVTLKFLGDVEPERLRAVWSSAVQALDGGQPFTVRFRGLGAFPNPGRARVVWAGIREGAEALADLAARVEEACEKHGFPREGRPFRAHITLGRVRNPAPNAALAAALAEQSEADLGEARLDRTFLMKSELTRAGAVYQVLDEALLGKGSI